MMNTAQWLAREIADTRDWTLKLLADLDGADWTFQPSPGTAHALWLCGHLAASQQVLIHERALGKPFLDPEFIAHFPIGRDVASADQHQYPPVSSVLATMADVHERTLAAVSVMTDSFLAEPCWGKDGAPHPHYTDKLGAIVHASRHEAFHAGQIATIRRMLGKTFLR